MNANAKTDKAIPKLQKVSPLNIVADSHVGLVRECNEDSYVYYVSNDAKNAFAAVADGIGGHEGGDIASRICMQTMVAAWKRQNLPNTDSHRKIRKFLQAQTVKANKIIYDINQSYNIQHPMGTTVVAAVFQPSVLTIAHAGDSRCYRLRNEVLTQLTEDHSYVAELVKNDLISLEEAKIHPFSHIISRSVGPIQDIEVEINSFEWELGDRYLLCSDGLNAHLDDVEIETILAENDNPYDTVRELLFGALRGGGEDNITVMCLFT
jgi:protein phosphatase